VVDLFRRDARDTPLIVDGRRAERPVIDVDVRAADLAVRLDREEAGQKVAIFLGHLREISRFDAIGELRH